MAIQQAINQKYNYAQPRHVQSLIFYVISLKKKLNHLVEEGTLEPVEVSECTSPIVSVLKSNKITVRICGRFKQTVNPVSTLDKYPIPKVEGLFFTLAGEGGGEKFQ